MKKKVTRVAKKAVNKTTKKAVKKAAKKSIKKAAPKKTVKKKTAKTEIGTIRIKVKDVTPVIKTQSGWKKAPAMSIDNIQAAVHKYKAHANFTALVSAKDNTFLKGELGPHGEVRGERVNVLPNGEKLEKAFSLFAPHLTIHDEKTNDHWDVLFQNPNGSLAHVYSV